MRTVFFVFLFFCGTFSFAQNTDVVLPLIPKPVKLTRSAGEFILTKNTRFYSDDKLLIREMAFFNDYLKFNHGFEISQTTNPFEKNTIKLLRTSDQADSLKGAYQLSIAPNKMVIKGDTTGVFYAMETLIQLINGSETSEIKLPCLTLNDKPAFAWRGMHLDVCRHFFPVSFVKRYIDLLALYKFNTFHWHLTEDQGWRIEIKKYPKLTQIGAYRKGSMIGKYSDQKFDTIRYGGFYTQEEIKEVVAYAQKRHMTIVPEIEMPGHALAAIASYPYLSCTGKQYGVARAWGVFDEVYCPKDSTFKFLEDVLTEVMALFPGKYIHIGGDECPKTNWKKCAHCQQVIKTEGLKDEHELQSYFIRRIEKFVNKNGKQIIGWDEILEGGLAPNASVMSWRGTEGGIAAAQQKHTVVMSPGEPLYFDHYQSKDIKNEPLAIGGYNPVDSVYAYDPIPNILTKEESKYILGAQGNVWTEYILNEKQVEYMAVPRMCALSEVVWCGSKDKNFTNFSNRLKLHKQLLDRMRVNYANHFLMKN
jgi:hexosaminidase